MPEIGTYRVGFGCSGLPALLARFLHRERGPGMDSEQHTGTDGTTPDCVLELGCGALGPTAHNDITCSRDSLGNASI